MTDLATDALPLDRLRLFPLPVVLFPGQQLPLHIFEPRYREMMKDALADAPFLTVVCLAPPPREDPPRIEQVATVGRIEQSVRLEDGRFDLLLRGVARVRLEEYPSGKQYRMARGTLLGEPAAGAQSVPAVETQAMLRAASALVSAVQARRAEFRWTAPESQEPGTTAFAIAMQLVPENGDRQSILETQDARARVRRVTEALAETLLRITPSRTGTN